MFFFETSVAAPRISIKELISAQPLMSSNTSFTSWLCGTAVLALKGETPGDLARSAAAALALERETLGDLTRSGTAVLALGGEGERDRERRLLSGSGGAGGVGGCGASGSDHGFTTVGRGSRVLDEHCVAAADPIVDASSWPYLRSPASKCRGSR